MTEQKNTNYSFYFCLAIGFILFAAPVFFLQCTVPVGICCTLGFFFLLLSAKKAQSRKEIVLFFAVLWFATAIRLSTFFGYQIGYICLIFAVMLPYSFVIGVSMLLERLIFRHKSCIFSVLIFPAAYTALSILMVSLNLGAPINVAGYAMCLPVMQQNLSWLGEYGMTFILMLVLSLAAYGVQADSVRIRCISILSSIIIIVALFSIGAILLSKEETPDDFLRVAVATSEQSDFLGNTDKVYTKEDHLAIFTNAVKTAAASNADLLVLNEEFYTIEAQDTNAVMKDISQVIQTYGIPVLVCMDLGVENQKKRVNQAVFFDENGTSLATNIKNNLVPIIESGDYVDGSESPMVLTHEFHGRSVKLACIVCFDLNDAFYVRKIPQDTELLLVPSWDWDTCNLEQNRTCIRSIERNTTILKHTFDGFTYVSGPYGLYGDMLDNRGQYEAVKIMDIPIWEK